LSIKLTKKQRSTDYLVVYGTVTNNNPVSIKGVSIKIAAYNAAKEIVSDGVGYVASGQYLKSNQTGYFKVMLSDESQEITSVDATVEPVYAFSVAQ
jgi:hypothetical protein